MGGGGVAARAHGAPGTGLRSALRRCSGAREGRRAVPAGWGDHSEEALRVLAGPCSRSPQPQGNLPRGCTRVHTRRVTAGGSPGVPRVSPGWEGSPRPGPHSPGIPLPPGPALPARSAISLASLPRRAKRAGWRQPLAPGPSSAHQETGSCSPRRCPSQFEHPREGGPLARSWVHSGHPGE